MSKIVKLKITSASADSYAPATLLLPPPSPLPSTTRTINYFVCVPTWRIRNIFQQLSHYVYAISRRVAHIDKKFTQSDTLLKMNLNHARQVEVLRIPWNKLGVAKGGSHITYLSFASILPSSLNEPSSLSLFNKCMTGILISLHTHTVAAGNANSFKMLSTVKCSNVIGTAQK